MDIIKCKICCWIQSVEKSAKNHPKSYRQKSSTVNYIFSVTFSLITFLLFFQWIQNQHPNFSFFYNIHMTLLRKNFFCNFCLLANHHLQLWIILYPVFGHGVCQSPNIYAIWVISQSYVCSQGLPITLYKYKLEHFL